MDALTLEKLLMQPVNAFTENGKNPAYDYIVNLPHIKKSAFMTEALQDMAATKPIVDWLRPYQPMQLNVPFTPGWQNQPNALSPVPGTQPTSPPPTGGLFDGFNIPPMWSQTTNTMPFNPVAAGVPQYQQQQATPFQPAQSQAAQNTPFAFQDLLNERLQRIRGGGF